MKRNVWATPKGWHDIGSDVSWDEYGGKWAKFGHGRAYYVIDFTNMIEACGSDAEGGPKYVAEVRMVDLADLPHETILSALKCCGLRFGMNGPACTIESDSGDIVAQQETITHPGTLWDLVIVEACSSYGAYAPLDSVSGDSHPVNVRGKARRIAERIMRDAAERERLMARPVNRLGSTAREYMRGDLDAPLARASGPGAEGGAS